MNEGQSVPSIIFDAVCRGGKVEIERLVMEKVPESVWLDYKLARANKRRGDRGRKEDWESLSVACCGFANTEGGVIIWGVNARSLGEGEPDVPQWIEPIENSKEFHTWLEREASLCVSPPVQGIRHEIVPWGDGACVAATLIPEGRAVPHRRAVGDSKGYHFVLRTGSSFIQAPLPLLEGMFGRPPRADVDLAYICTEARRWEDGLVIEFACVMHNSSSVLAEDLFVCMKMPFIEGHSEFKRAFHEMAGAEWESASGYKGEVNLITKPGFRLPPSASAYGGRYTLMLRPPFVEDSRLKVTFGCKGIHPVQFEVDFGAPAMGSLPEQVRAAAGEDNRTKDAATTIVREYLRNHGLPQ